jgi:acylphosphatase
MAESQGVSGWCRNLADGRVEVVFEGEPAAVEGAVAWCRGGPPSALVTSVDVVPETPKGERGFGLG